MSFILDALKKSEAERQRQSAPGLIEPGIRAPHQGLPVWAVAGLVLLAINAIALSVVLLRRPAPQAAIPGAAPIRRQAPAAPLLAAPAPAAAAPPFSPMDEGAVDAPEIPLVAAREPRGTPPRARTAPATDGASVDDELLPTIDQMHFGAADALPPLHLDIHVYAANPAERFVFINARKYTEGSTLQEGPKVERIRRDGVVLDYRGRRFLLPRQ
ncbi:MAG TPA: general secretion pathway protein GspB [Steroidobacteraceae bacterium]|nr:general secretion pathway protein GspB [Steroidobacteraceae bacterium]